MLPARLVETLRRCVPCRRCRALTEPSQTYFDRLGNQVCGECHDKDEIAAGDQRVRDREMQEKGVSAYALQEDKEVKWCPRFVDDYLRPCEKPPSPSCDRLRAARRGARSDR